MDLWHSLGGMITVEITTADIFSFLTCLQDQQVSIWNIEKQSDLQYRFRIRRRDLSRLQALAVKRGEQIKTVHTEGLYWLFRTLLHRPVLVLGMIILLVLSLWIPSRVFFVRVEGNTSIPDLQIMEKAADCGIGFAASRREVRSEKIKNSLLNAMPQLQWAGVNTYGCVAVITVRERGTAEETEKPSGISNVIASQDAVIDEITVLQGTALCKPGQAVFAGQKLISGYTDCGIYIQAGRAEGEVFGITKRNISAVCPVYYSFRQGEKYVKKKYSLILGKKRINFAKDSGILGDTCAKIELDYNLMLPGGFSLPVCLAVEHYYAYDTRTDILADAQSILEDYSRDYLLKQMIAGEIRHTASVFTDTEGLARLDSTFACREMIGISCTEEFIYGKTD